MVVLPAPSGPTRPKISPGATERFTSSTATRSPNVLVSPLASMAAGISAPAEGTHLAPAPIRSSASAGIPAFNSRLAFWIMTFTA